MDRCLGSVELRALEDETRRTFKQQLLKSKSSFNCNGTLSVPELNPVKLIEKLFILLLNIWLAIGSERETFSSLKFA